MNHGRDFIFPSFSPSQDKRLWNATKITKIIKWSSSTQDIEQNVEKKIPVIINKNIPVSSISSLKMSNKRIKEKISNIGH